MRTSHAAAAAIAALLAVLLAGAPARAQPDAFSAAVAVADRGDAEREAAYAAGLRRVLLDNAPDRTLMNRDDVRAALLDAAAYVETFRFDVPEPGSGIEPGTPVTDAVRRSGEAVGLLRVRFDRTRVLGLIEAAGEAVPAVAPAPPADGSDPFASGAGPADPAAERAFANVRSVLVWLLIEDGERTISGSDPAALKVRERVREIAGGAGVTVAFGDADGLDPEALRALDAAAIQAASLRYATDAVLVGRLARGAGDALPGVDPPGTGPSVAGSSGESGAAAPGTGAPGIDLRDRLADARAARRTATGWNGRWLKLAAPAAPDPDAPDAGGADGVDGGARAAVALRTATDDERLDDALRAGLGWLLPDVLSGAGTVYAYGGRGDPAEGLVWVGSIDSVADYARAMALFESVPGVESVYPRSVADGAGVFVVRPRRALEGIASAAARTDWLRRGAPPLDAVDPAGRDDAGGDGAGGATSRLAGGAPDDGPGARRGVRPAGRESFAELARQSDLAFDVLP